MMSYAGSKAIGVNPYSKNMVPAVELAVYLGSAEAQLSHYNKKCDSMQYRAFKRYGDFRRAADYGAKQYL